MKFRKCAALLLIAALLVVSVKQSEAGPALPPAPVVAGSGVSAGIWISGTIIGIAAFLGIYDIARRTSCVGDFLKMGGPGFDRTITPIDTVLKPPVCNKARARR